ncbi:MAG: energy transducer TonB [Xanthomonadales bacterium]|nr:energy transducer TonB [Xanthomonadales bacterium]MBP6077231.1 energy transducer TonB [Xanthomonadales bacterium]MBP7622757.1 energy transducer TonB [Xanthomonadales bacterium]
MSLPPLVHLSLHVEAAWPFPPATAPVAGDGEDPAAALAGWSRRPPAVTANGLNGPRVLGLSASIALHLLALALLLGAADPERPTALGESEVDALEIEFLQPAPEPVPVAPAPPAAQPKPVVADVPRVETRTPAEPDVRLPLPEAVPEPVPTPPLVAAVTPQPPSAYAPASPPLPAPDRPLTARGKRAQSQYLRELMLWLARHRVYPAAAKKQKLEGIVQVRFAIDRDGHLLSAAVHRSAGIELLDAAALDVLRRADPMPKFPKALERSRLSVTLPIDFSLITD